MFFPLIVSFLFLHACRASSPVQECKSIEMWSFAIRDFLFLPEEAMTQRVVEWSKFCDSVSNQSALSPALLQSMWLEQTTFLPLASCDCLKSPTASQHMDTAESISATVFVDYPILGLILIVLAYLLRIYHARYRGYDVSEPTPQTLHGRHVHQPSHDIHRGSELLR